jgi:hypothetical protein
MLKAITGAVIGGLIGAAIWAAISYTTNYELGIIAWGIGLLVGGGAALLGGDDLDMTTGIAAATIALGSVGLGKYASVEFAVRDAKAEISSTIEIDDTTAIVHIADMLIEDMEREGKTIKWPDGVNPDEATTEAEYPAEIWKSAKADWTKLTPQEQTEFKSRLDAEFRSSLDVVAAEVGRQAFRDSFSPFDLLWAALALFTAFKLGSGDGGGD